MEHKLFVVGGHNGTVCLSSVERYDPHTNNWINISPMIEYYDNMDSELTP
jgi:hypothetical protein